MKPEVNGARNYELHVCSRASKQRICKPQVVLLLISTKRRAFEIEENKRMGKTRDLFKKMKDTKGKFHAKMGSIKDRNGRDLTEAEDTKKWQGYTEELYKKIFMTQIITMV